MNKRIKTVIVIIFGCSCGLVFADEVAYVTDSLQLRVYANPTDTSDVIETIESGDSIEMLENQGAFSRVRTYQGSTGWVKSAFLVEEPPAKLLYYSVSEQNKQLEQQIQALQKTTTVTSDSDTDQIAELEQKVQDQQQTKLMLQEQIELLKQENQQQNALESRVELTSFSATKNIANTLLNDKRVLAALAVALLLFGFLIGIKLSSRRMRKRLHGFSLG